MTINEKWDKRYLEIARTVGEWSKDPSTKIGAVIVGDKGQIISQGYNGFPRGIEDTKERYNDRPTKYKLVVHAEANALYNALHTGASTDGATIYVTALPTCHECAKALIQAGIKRVVMDAQPETEPGTPAASWKESCDLAIDLFHEAGVNWRFIERE